MEILNKKDLDKEELEIGIITARLKETKKDMPSSAYNRSWKTLSERTKELERKKKIIADMNRR